MGDAEAQVAAALGWEGTHIRQHCETAAQQRLHSIWLSAIAGEQGTSNQGSGGLNQRSLDVTMCLQADTTVEKSTVLKLLSLMPGMSANSFIQWC